MEIAPEWPAGTLRTTGVRIQIAVQLTFSCAPELVGDRLACPGGHAQRGAHRYPYVLGRTHIQRRPEHATLVEHLQDGAAKLRGEGQSLRGRKIGGAHV